MRKRKTQREHECSDTLSFKNKEGISFRCASFFLRQSGDRMDDTMYSGEFFLTNTTFGAHTQKRIPISCDFSLQSGASRTISTLTLSSLLVPSFLRGKCLSAQGMPRTFSGDLGLRSLSPSVQWHKECVCYSKAGSPKTGCVQALS